MKFVSVAVRSLSTNLSHQFYQTHMIRSLSTWRFTDNGTGEQHANKSESPEEFGKFGENRARYAQFDSFLEKINQPGMARQRPGSGNGASSEMMHLFEESHDTLLDGMDVKLKNAATYFEVDEEEINKEDYAFRYDANFPIDSKYDVKALDLTKPGVRKPPARNEFSVTTKEVLSQADFRNVRFLAKFITEAGIIIKRSKTGISAKAQRKVAREIKTARAFGLMPFTTMGTKSFIFGRTMKNLDEDFEYESKIEDGEPDMEGDQVLGLFIVSFLSNTLTVSSVADILFVLGCPGKFLIFMFLDNGTGDQHANKSESPEEFGKFGENRARYAQFDSVLEKINQQGMARQRPGSGNGASSEMMHLFEEIHDTLSDGMDGKLKNAATYFEVDEEEINKEDYAFRYDANFPIDLKYDVKNLEYVCLVLLYDPSKPKLPLHLHRASTPNPLQQNTNREIQRTAAMASPAAMPILVAAVLFVISIAKSADPHDCAASRNQNTQTLRRDKVTVLINGFSESRIPLLQSLAAAYSLSPVVSSVLVLWGNPATAPLVLRQLAHNLSFSSSSAPISLLPQPSASLNNRFLPRPSHISTDAVLICDDDVEVDPRSLEFAFRVWEKNPQRLVGVFARSHDLDLNRREWVYTVHPDRFSIVLTKFMLLRGHYLFLYTCGGGAQMARARAIVDAMHNCEDVLMNMVVAEEAQVGPVLVWAKRVRDYGDSRNEGEEAVSVVGLSSRKREHRKRRGWCIQEFHRVLGTMPLRYTYGKIVDDVREQGLCYKGGNFVFCDRS
ncbi:unnamed protein product [Sphenostylis stenocarpa]|uniref:Small ribosomal subunit protein bS18c n=1 Tax=Sphenostylis stenocarpa TaxID=92480 RepID=A0AA86T5Q7_9FABA|nr:unnamed protein product [Sphenostylis stenocarpa]